MENLVENIINKIRNTSKQYNIKELEKFCFLSAIPKEFQSSENISEVEDELKAFTLGSELFKEIVGRKYNIDNLENISEIKEAGVYQFLQATLQDEVTSIITDEYYLTKLLKLYGQDIEEFDKNLFNGLKIDKYSTVGLIRDINQDSLKVYSSGKITLLMVADGVGGGEHGEIASKIACDTALISLKNQTYSDKTEYEIKDLLNKAIMNANRAVIDYADKEEIDTIGTTLSIALIYNKKLFVGHVGDSRIYRIYGNQKPELITQDHSLPEILFRSGDITEDEKINYKKNSLVYVIGKRDLKEENIYINQEPNLNQSDKLFLCSDGVWDIKGVEDKFDGDVKELKRYILDSIPTDNATFIRCKFDYKGEQAVTPDIGHEEDKVEENSKPVVFDNWNKDVPKESDKVDLIIEEEKSDSSDNKILWSLIGGVILGIGYLLYPYISNLFIKDINTTETSAPNKSIATPLPIATKSITLPKENVSKPLATMNTIKNKVKEISVAKKEPTSMVIKTYKKSQSSKVAIPIKKRPKIKEVIAKLDTSSIYKKSDLLILDKTKIWFGKNFIKTDKKGCFKALVNTNQFICKLKIDVLNPKITDKLEKIKFGKVKIGRHKKEIWIVVTLNNDYKCKIINQIENKEYKEEIIFSKKEEESKEINKTEKIPQENNVKKKVVNPMQHKIEYWSNSDGVYLGKTLVATFTKDRITLTSGDCQIDGVKWVCIVLNRRIKKFQNITYQLKHQKFAESIVLNPDYLNQNNTRIVITLKQGYMPFSDKKINGKQVLVFFKQER